MALLVTNSSGNFSTVKSSFTLCEGYNLFASVSSYITLKGSPYSFSPMPSGFSTSYNITGIVLALYTEDSSEVDCDITVELQYTGTTVASCTLTAAQITNSVTNQWGQWIVPFTWSGIANDNTTYWSIKVTQGDGAGTWKLKSGSNSYGTAPFFALISDYTQAFSSGDSVIFKDKVVIDEDVTFDTTVGGIINAYSTGAAVVVCKSSSAITPTSDNENLQISSGVTLNCKGRFMLGAHSGVRAGYSTSRIPYASKSTILFSAPSSGTDVSGFSCPDGEVTFHWKSNFRFFGQIPTHEFATLYQDVSGSTIYLTENVTSGDCPWSDGDQISLGKQMIKGAGDTETVYTISGTPTWDGTKSTVVLTANVTGNRKSGGKVIRYNGYGIVIKSDSYYTAVCKIGYATAYILNGVQIEQVILDQYSNYESGDDEANLEPYKFEHISIRDKYSYGQKTGFKGLNIPYSNGFSMRYINVVGTQIFEKLNAVGGNIKISIDNIICIGYSYLSYSDKNLIYAPYVSLQAIAQNYDSVAKFKSTASYCKPHDCVFWGNNNDTSLTFEASNIKMSNMKADNCLIVYHVAAPQIGLTDSNPEYGQEVENDAIWWGVDIYTDVINPLGIVNTVSNQLPYLAEETLHIKNYNRVAGDNRTLRRVGTLYSNDGESLVCTTAQPAEPMENIYQFFANAIAVAGVKLSMFVNVLIQGISYYSGWANEKITNGKFTSDLTSWTVGTGWSFLSKAAQFLADLGTEIITNGGFEFDLSNWTIEGGWAWDAGSFAKFTQSYGSSLLYNGTFDTDLSYWTAGAGWAQNSGVAQYTPQWGSNIISNGGFNGDASGWTLDSDWSYNSYNVYCNPSSYNSLTQSGLSLTANKKYKVTFDVSYGNSSAVNIYLGGQLIYNGSLYDGSFSYEGTTNSSPDGNFYILTQGFCGYITNISIAPIADASSIYQTVSPTSGKTYKVYAYIGGSVGTVQISFNGSVLATVNAGSGAYQTSVLYTSGSGTLEFLPSADSDCNVDNVEISEVQFGNIKQSPYLTSGKTYKVYAYVGGSTGTLTIKLGGTTLATVNAGSGAYNGSYLCASTGNKDLEFIPSTGSDVTIDDVSVKEILVGDLSQGSLSLTNGKLYKYTFKIGGTTGNIDVTLNGETTNYDAGDGVITGTFTYDSGNPASIVFSPSTDFDGYVDSVSILEQEIDVTQCTLPTITVGYDNGTEATDQATNVLTKQTIGVIVEPTQDYQFITASLIQQTTFPNSPVTWDTLNANLRKYGKIFQNQLIILQDTYKDTVGNFQDLTDNPFITEANPATVAGYTGISIDHDTETCEITTAHTIQELYDYAQYDLTQDANMNIPEWFTTTDGITFYSKYNITVNGVILSGAGLKLNLGSKTFTTTSGGSTSAIVTDVNGTLVGVSLVNVITGSQCYIAKISDSTEILNQTASGSEVTINYQQTIDVDVIVTVRKAGYQEWTTTGTITANGLLLTVNQIVDPTY